MLDALNEGMDLHLKFAADVFLGGTSYEEALARKKDKDVKDARQRAKAANFGYPGGLGADRFIDYAKGYGVTLTRKESEAIKEAWLKQWPEMRRYFQIMSALTRDDAGVFEQYVSKRIRGGLRYTQACNTPFQGLAADMMKEGCYDIQKACYTPGNVLYGSRLVIVVHDETVMEHPIATAHERAYEQARIMGDALLKYCPDLKRKDPEPALMDCWLKGAEAKFDENGRLIPWA